MVFAVIRYLANYYMLKHVYMPSAKKVSFTYEKHVLLLCINEYSS